MSNPESKVSASVEEMVAALNYASAKANVGGERRTSDGLLDACDYILTAQSAIAEAHRERDLAIAHDRQPYPTAHAYETVCARLAERDAEIADYRQTSGDLCPVCSWRGVRGYGCEFCALVEAKREIAEMRKITGPKCPKCGHWLKAEHDEYKKHRGAGYVGDNYLSCRHCEDYQMPCPCRLPTTDLLTNHPDIAAEMNITPKESLNV